MSRPSYCSRGDIGYPCLEARRVLEGRDLLPTGARPSPAGGAASSPSGRGPPPPGLGLLPGSDDGEGGERWMQVVADGKGVAVHEYVWMWEGGWWIRFRNLLSFIIFYYPQVRHRFTIELPK